MNACDHDETESCQDCCQHEEHDHGICLYCEADITDNLVSKAEAYWEGDR